MAERKDYKLTIIMALISTLGGGGMGYYSGLAAIGERVRAVEVRQDEQYKALKQGQDDLKASFGESRKEILLDLNGTRGEILNILRERRR